MQSRFFAAGVIALALAAPAVLAQPLQDAPPTSQTAGQTPGQAGPMHHRPLPKPTNLQVLPKDIAPEQLIKIMRGFAGALGVECSFCHAGKPQTHHLDFASDAKPEKATARLMMHMVQTIDTDYLAKINDPDATPADKHVTCGTCHRGHSMPTQFVPPPEEHPGPTAPPPAGPPQ